MKIYEVMGYDCQQVYEESNYDEFGFFLKQESAAKSMEEEIQKKMEYFKEYGGEIVLEIKFGWITVADWATCYNILEDGERMYYFWIREIVVNED